MHHHNRVHYALCAVFIVSVWAAWGARIIAAPAGRPSETAGVANPAEEKEDLQALVSKLRKKIADLEARTQELAQCRSELVQLRSILEDFHARTADLEAKLVQNLTAKDDRITKLEAQRDRDRHRFVEKIARKDETIKQLKAEIANLTAALKSRTSEGKKRKAPQKKAREKGRRQKPPLQRPPMPEDYRTLLEKTVTGFAIHDEPISAALSHLAHSVKIPFVINRTGLDRNGYRITIKVSGDITVGNALRMIARACPSVCFVMGRGCIQVTSRQYARWLYAPVIPEDTPLAEGELGIIEPVAPQPGESGT